MNNMNMNMNNTNMKNTNKNKNTKIITKVIYLAMPPTWIIERLYLFSTATNPPLKGTGNLSHVEKGLS